MAQTQAVSVINQVRDLFQKSKSEIEAALPKHLSADRMLRIAMTEIRQNPKLLECEPKSLIGAVIQASQLGLEPGSALGHCYLIPFKNNKKGTTEVQFMPGYRGFLDLARRSGAVTHIVSRAVYSCDEFEFEYGLDERLVHKPGKRVDADTLTHVYAIAFLKEGGRQFDVMDNDDVNEIRARSKSADSGPWNTDYEAMAKKTVIRRLFKYLPVSIEIQRAVGLDEQAECGISQENRAIVDVESTVEDAPAAPAPAEKQINRVKVARSKDDVQKAAEPKPEEPVQGGFASFQGSTVPAPMTRDQMAERILKLGEQAGFTIDDLTKMVQTKWSKNPDKLTSQEMVVFISDLEVVVEGLKGVVQ